MSLRSGVVRRLGSLRRFIRPMDRAVDVLAQMAQLPFAPVEAITGPQPILVLAPHPDDESLGCGGLIAQACAAGTEVHVVIVTDGTGSHPHSLEYPAARLKAVRRDEAAAAVETLGLPPGRLSFFDYRDSASPRRGAALRDAAQRLAAFTRERGIATVFSTWKHDPHPDHVSAHRIAALASGIAGFRLMSYAVWGWTLPPGRWLPRQAIRGVRLDVSSSLPLKQRAISCHQSQMTDTISDDPSGFQLPQGLLDICNRRFETFLQHPG